MTFFVCRMLVGSSFLTLALSMALAQGVEEEAAIELISANLQAGIEQSLLTVEVLNQEVAEGEMEGLLEYIYAVQMGAGSSTLSFQTTIDNLSLLAETISEDSLDYSALEEIYYLATAGYDAFSFIKQWTTDLSSALLTSDEQSLTTLLAQEYQDYIAELLNQYGEALIYFADAYDDNSESSLNTDEAEEESALSYLDGQDESAYSSDDTYALMSDISSWGHGMSMSIMDSWPAGGGSYYCQRGIDLGCY
ncbi:MAG: hypothetical protein R2880_17395 [Deinococcales bacterium]